MNRSRTLLYLGGGLLVLMGLLSCSLSNLPARSAEAPSSTEVSMPTEAPAESSTEAPNGAATEAPVESPTEASPNPTAEAPAEAQAEVAPACDEDVCVFSDAFPLRRPISADYREQIDPSYRFGTSNHGKRDIHTGVELLNPRGTPVLAAAKGDVVFAGDDLKKVVGPYRNYYGNYVVLQHDFPGFDKPVFTLYAHLSEIDVKEGDDVKAGDQIGLVGSTGAATGAHLHFEVRYGENEYFSVRNPEMWLQPLPDEDGQQGGAIAGRFLDKAGKLVTMPNIVIERLAGPGLPAQNTYYINTYEDRKMIGKEPWGESFAISDLPAGDYQITYVKNGVQTRLVEVLPGQLSMVTIQFDQ
jgi:murein DD-endopeptidase MepM/ murein hydrolase activator NlpD